MMKLGRFVALALIVGVLLGSVAWTAHAADGDVTMWVHRARLAYTGRSSGGPDAMVGMIHVRDADLNMVPDVTVEAEWTLPDGSVEAVSSVSNFAGIARFSVWEGRGTYKLCVTDMTKAGWTYDSTLDRETCPVFVVR